MARIEAIAAALVAVAAAVFALVVVPAQTDIGFGASVPPELLPIGALAVVAILSLVWFASALVRGAAEGHDRAVPGDWPLSARRVRRAAIFLALLGASLAAIQALGLLVGGAALIAAFMVFAGERRPIYIAPVSIGTAASVYVLMSHVLHIPPP